MAPTRPKRAGGEKRGSSYDRRRRKANLLARHGDGITCPCSYCDTVLTGETLEQDRIQEGGAYRMNNLIPACRRCNLERSDESFESYIATKARNPERAAQFAQIAQNA